MENPFRRFKAQAAGAIHDQFRDEFDDFIRATPHIIGEQSALDWWLKPARQFVYPNLSKMASTIFSIPPMSAEPERVFSGTKHTIAPERIRRGAEMVEITECLKS
ncbi:recq helicase tlh3 [Fusarium flagelliforme]|uniref:Recq helicase tlh3 n=1 Tax=Fusarium flagelliforme TaxID=2675880 RepID=A0A395M585_9HYPO|nr:recq helicase tlh3 [Fusarium flagelliforme]